VIISVDLLKDRKRLVRSYDDSAGVTAAFNKNILRVLNARYGANFNLDLFSHVVRWDESRRSIELFLRSAVAQKVRIAKLQLEISLSSGEEIRTLVAEKFVRRDFEDELREGDLCPVGWFTDYDRQIALSVSRPS
jgi:L-histidine N-alpha-methyltransferase